jgi:hypothetical protein
MAKAMTPTQLRANLYRVLDEVLATGRPQEIERGEGRLLIVPANPRRSLDDLPKRKLYTGNFDDVVETSWADSWKPDV